ncbi:pfs domain-containing protein [Trichoderma gamsii]|uniref:Pfs domain-containing protein n=1 Tax=Trichoderma gamsii TaxID=398673 RepID=A0A2P4ZTQ3_9HYPO|nr:pfs domain-containing protein [Trichoderma gamsii]PON27623.1 pfs domain-containing protein [Trichoderma gamsii]
MSKPAVSRPASRDEFEIAIVCALPFEYNAVVILLDQCWDEEGDPYGRARGDNNTYTTGSMGGFNIVVLLLPGIGKVEAAGSAASLRSSYPDIKVLFLNGICGGVPFVKGEELLLGDVIISKTVVQYDRGSRYPDAFKTTDTIDAQPGRASKNIRSFTAILETDRGSDRLEKRAAFLLDVIQRTFEERDQRHRKTVTYAYPGSSNDKLFEPSYHHKHRTSPTCRCSNSDQNENLVCEASRKLSCDQLGCDPARLVPRIRIKQKKQLEEDGNIKDAQAPSVFIGRVGSGDTVLKSGIGRDRLAREHDILAFETEGSGIWDEYPCIIVKGVCDYADSHNNKDWQNFAAATAASVVKGLIEHYPKTDQRVAALVKNPGSTQIEDSRENRECLRDLRSTDPADDKKRIQMTKGGLLRDSYAWILTNGAFMQWRNDPKCPLLWIRGNPGKGKTMLLCGIADEIEKSAAYNLSYFFCQQTDSRINNSVAILRGLIYMLVRKQHSYAAYPDKVRRRGQDRV